MSAHHRHGPSCTVSRHQTSEGVLVYRRCHCGALQVALHQPGRRPTVIGESRHTDPAHPAAGSAVYAT